LVPKTVKVTSVVRSFATAFCAAQLQAYQQGTLSYLYRGIPCLKSPIDIAIYLRLLFEKRPRTIFEIGSKHGGSALLFRDMARMMEFPSEVVSIDISPPREAAVDGVSFLAGDVRNLEGVFLAASLWSRPRPWMVIEDSAHTFEACTAALAFFAQNLQAGEYLVIEDGVLADLGLSDRYDGGPNRAIEHFLKKSPDVYEIDTSYCDMFGVNATYNPNGYLKKL